MADRLVIGIDGLDGRLVDRWELNHLRLERSRRLEAHAWYGDQPSTFETWPFIATGSVPDTLDTSDRGAWESTALTWLSRVTPSVVPQRLRSRIGRFIRNRFDAEFDLPEIDPSTSIFDNHIHWPGVYNRTLRAVMRTSRRVSDGRMDRQEGDRRVWRLYTDAIDMAAVLSGYVGVQHHYLDYSGHVNCESPALLRECYERMDEAVGDFLETYDGDVLLCSDHGMQTSVTGDDDPGRHSYHAFIAARGDWQEPLPEHMLNVHDYLKRYARSSDTPEETLRDLGYLSAGGGE